MQDFRVAYERYKEIIDERLKTLAEEGDRKPRSLDAPVRYALSGGGKRIRPILLVLGYEAVNRKVGGAANLRLRNVIHAALAIEALHNFTLVHDDIMDNAPSRRGRATVHVKWDEVTAILVGDELVALAYRSLMRTRTSRLPEILSVFTNGLVDVCEGQGFDKDFQIRKDVSLRQYLTMIEKKTARMVVVALEIGALVGGGTHTEVNALKNYGCHIGRAFQIKDDLLDIVGGKRFGKKIGGDILERKKTYLFLKAREVARREDRRFLDLLMAGRRIHPSDIARVRDIYANYGVVESAEIEVQKSVEKAKGALRALRPTSAKKMLFWLTDVLQDRRH